MTFGERLKELRTEKKLSMDEVGEYIGVGRANIYKYEHGIVVNIPADKLEKLARLFRVSKSYLMGWTDDRDGNISNRVEVEVTDRAYTQKELDIINALVKCTAGNICNECSYNGETECVDKLMRDVLDMINSNGPIRPKKYPPTRYSDTTFGCRACGHELPEGKPRFCPECGRPVKWEE